MTGQPEAFSRILIDKALEFSGWDLLDPSRFSSNSTPQRSSGLSAQGPARPRLVRGRSKARRPRPIRRQGAGERVRRELKAPFIILSNGREHWFWNYERADQRDAYRIERLPSRRRP